MECIRKEDIGNIMTIKEMRPVAEMHIFFLFYDISISIIQQFGFPLFFTFV